MTDEERKMAVMNRWLDQVCAELGVDRKVLDASTGTLLRLVGEVAHGPSRPGAPLTAFVVGLAAGAAERTPEAQAVAVGERVDLVSRLVLEWRAEERAAGAGDGAQVGA